MERQLPENYERDTQAFEELNKLAFPDIGQIRMIRRVTGELGYDKCRIEVSTDGVVESVRYVFLKGRKIVRQTNYVVIPEETP